MNEISFQQDEIRKPEIPVRTVSHVPQTNPDKSAQDSQDSRRFSIGEAAGLACLLEASAPKTGNVHRGADFEDCTLYDFLASAASVQSVFNDAESLTVGHLVQRSIQLTRQTVGTNTNLGIVLLLAPLAKIDFDQPDPFPDTSADIKQAVQKVLNHLTLADRDEVIDAIRLAKPGGLGKVKDSDIHDPSLLKSDMPLVKIMRLGREHDSIARQYSDGFVDVIDIVLPAILDSLHACPALPDAIVFAQLKVMAAIPDSLIQRKCGPETSTRCSEIARAILENHAANSPGFHAAVADFDFFLRSEGHRRNPGTTADLLAAGIFLALRTGQIDRRRIRESLESARLLHQSGTP